MTRSIAYVHEPAGSYMGSPTDTNYKVPGTNVEVTDLSLQNALQRMSVPNQLEYVDAVEQTFEGSFEATWTHTIPWHYDHVFGSAPSQSGTGPYTYTWSFSPGRMASSRWYMGFDNTSGTVERELKGVVFGQYEVTFSVGSEVRVTATGFYGDEARNTSLTPGSYVGETAPAMTFDGGSVEIPDSSTLAMVQEGTLTIENISRLQRGLQRKPVDAVVQNPQTSLQLQKVLTDTSQLALAYGNSTAPVTSSDVSGAATGTLTFTTTGTPAVTFDLDTVTPDTYNWANLANKDEDVLEDVDYLVNSVSVEATSDEASAL